ncbi:MAG TPA: hypothetical protein PK364_14250, partial [Synergistaceae bacterium]|nr:hypothetical protein [Synergistaceae bacterium]
MWCGKKTVCGGVVLLVLLVFSLAMRFAPAEAYHLWYYNTPAPSSFTGSEPYRWPGELPSIRVSVNTADETVRNAVLTEIKNMLNAW